MLVITEKDATQRSRLRIENEKETYAAALCFCIGLPKLKKNNIDRILCFEEQKHMANLLTSKRKSQYLAGRYAAKNAISLLTKKTEMSDIHIGYDVMLNPIIKNKGLETDLGISISHSNEICVSVAFEKAHPMAIDIEEIETSRASMITGQINSSEITLFNNIRKGNDWPIYVIMVWTIKESLSKILKTGLMTPFSLFEISRTAFSHPYQISYYRFFTQYKAISFQLGKYICSLALPRKSHCIIGDTFI